MGPGDEITFVREQVKRFCKENPEWTVKDVIAFNQALGIDIGQCYLKAEGGSAESLLSPAMAYTTPRAIVATLPSPKAVALLEPELKVGPKWTPVPK